MVRDVQRPRSRAAPLARWNVAILAGFFTLTLLTQIAVGAYRAERGAFSDEAVHFLNGLLVKQYLTHGLGQNPITFAAHFYDSYPKVAPLMWPPLFHGTLGLALLPGWPPQTVALLLVALATSWTAWRLTRILAFITRGSLVLALAALFVFTPAIVNLTSVVMLDVVVAAFALEAAYWLAGFFESGRTSDAAWFGVLAAGGCLTKGNGLAILLMPALMLLFTRRFDLLKRPGLYVAAAIVLVVAAPFSITSFYFDATIGGFRPTNWADIGARSRAYSTYLQGQVGLPLLALAAAGLISRTGQTDWRSDRHRRAFVPALASLALAAVLFHLLNPHVAFSGRDLTLAVAPIIGLVPNGIETLSHQLERPQWIVPAKRVLLAGLALVGIMNVGAWAPRTPLGFRDVTTYVMQHGGLADRRLIVVSDEMGEGAMIAEVAAHEPSPAATVIRFSSLIARGNWAGHDFHLRFASSAALIARLEALHVEFLVVDRSLEAQGHPLWATTEALLREQAARLERVHEAAGARPIVVYRLRYQSPGPPAPLEIQISSPFGRLVGR